MPRERKTMGRIGRVDEFYWKGYKKLWRKQRNGHYNPFSYATSSVSIRLKTIHFDSFHWWPSENHSLYTGCRLNVYGLYDFRFKKLMYDLKEYVLGWITFSRKTSCIFVANMEQRLASDLPDLMVLCCRGSMWRCFCQTNYAVRVCWRKTRKAFLFYTAEQFAGNSAICRRFLFEIWSTYSPTW